MKRRPCRIIIAGGDGAAGRSLARGFSMLELLVAGSVAVAVLAIASATMVSYRKLHFDLTSRVDVEADLRSAWDFIARDLENAGSRVIGNGELAHFGTVFPNADASDSFRSDRLTIWSNPSQSDAALAASMAAPSSLLRMDDVDGFVAGMQVWVIGFCADDIVRRQSFVISAVDAAAKTIDPVVDLVCPFQVATRVALLQQVTYSLSEPVAGRSDLLRAEDGGTAVLLAAGITSFRVLWLDGASPPAIFEPDNETERRAVRTLRIDLAGQSAQAARGSGIGAPPVLSGLLSPRNLVLQDIL